ncbi:MAG TPA: FHA domain-containing protein [Tepidisphaeraceae bacterium]|jgi:pSer/pThr/pTyr-binding forkhead associated (FHA) protein
MDVESLGELDSSTGPVLRVVGEDDRPKTVTLDRSVVVVGRQAPAHLPLPAKQVSKLHALILREQGRVYLRDLASTNGVQINGSTVREVGLADADQVRIGAYTLQCESGFGRGTAKKNGKGLDATDPSGLPAAELVGETTRFELPRDRKTFLIGRRGGCELKLDDSSVAPVHAAVYEMDGRRFVHDLNSPAGVTINGEKTRRGELHPGDELRVGDVALRYRAVETADEVPATDVAEAPPPAPVADADALDVLVEEELSPEYAGELIDSAHPDAPQPVPLAEADGVEVLGVAPVEDVATPVEVAVEEVEEVEPVALIEEEDVEVKVFADSPEESLALDAKTESEGSGETEGEAPAEIFTMTDELAEAPASTEPVSEVPPLEFKREAELGGALTYEDFGEAEADTLDWEAAGMMTIEEGLVPVSLAAEAAPEPVMLQVHDEPAAAVADAAEEEGIDDQARLLRAAVNAEKTTGADDEEETDASEVPSKEEISLMLADVMQRVARLNESWEKFRAHQDRQKSAEQI